mmetsp:Transcript_18268/g.28979  ORF Transcript_18268/g.28979 Transcript_18268/m.28979 type:complete len:211 (+) Transcript_18268:2100-2732(+)
MVNTDLRHLLCRLHHSANGALGLLHGVDFAKLHTTRHDGVGTNHTIAGLPGHGANTFHTRQPVRAVKPQNQTGNFGRPHIQYCDHTTLHCRFAHRAHGALALVKLCHCPTVPVVLWLACHQASTACSVSCTVGRCAKRISTTLMSRSKSSSAWLSATTRSNASTAPCSGSLIRCPRSSTRSQRLSPTRTRPITRSDNGAAAENRRSASCT